MSVAHSTVTEISTVFDQTNRYDGQNCGQDSTLNMINELHSNQIGKQIKC